jgi:hypothetical protein
MQGAIRLKSCEEFGPSADPLSSRCRYVQGVKQPVNAEEKANGEADDVTRHRVSRIS